MRVPLGGEAAWLLPGVAAPYWRARMAKLSYEFARWQKPIDRAPADNRMPRADARGAAAGTG